MLGSLLRFEIGYQSKQRPLPLFALLFGLFGLFMGGLGQAPAQVDFNAAYQISNHTTIASLGCVFIIMFFAVSGVIRDGNHQMEGLIFSTAVLKKHFFWSRFLGIFLFSMLGFGLFIPGLIAGLSLSDLDPERVAVFNLQSYIWPFFVIAIPNFFICTSLIFSVSILSKNALATYACAVLIYILYFLVSFYSNSPMMASSVPASPEDMFIAGLLDPFAGATFFEYTHFWTPFEKNTLMLSFAGSYFWNRLLWIGFSCMVLGITYYLFSFRKPAHKSREKAEKEQEVNSITSYFSVDTQTNIHAQFLAFWASFVAAIKGTLKSLPFLVIVLTLIGSLILELYTRIFEGGAYGDSWYPFTNLLIEIAMEIVPMLSIILIVLYSGELLWRSRDKKIDSIIYSTPVSNWAFYLSILASLSLIPMLLIGIVIIVCMGFQLINGFTSLDIQLYLSLFYYRGSTYLVYAMLALFIQIIMNNKYLGMAITAVVILFLGTPLSANLGIEHGMLRIGNMPLPIYSNMNGYSINTQGFPLYLVYWMAFGAILSILSFKLWKREIDGSSLWRNKPFKKWQAWERNSLLICIAIFVISGSMLFTELNVKNKYRNSQERMDYAEQYERQFKSYDTIPRLYPERIKTEVALYPSEEKYTVFADHILINKNKNAVTHLFLTERKILSELIVDSAKLIFKNGEFGTYLYKFDRPILPSKTARLRYRFTKKSSPYKMDRSILKNGTYIRHESFEPVLGYYSANELSDPYERQKRGLPQKENASEGDAHLFSYKARYGNVDYETIVSTEANQTALAPGNLIKQWTKDGRNYFQYKFPQKNVPALAYFSAAYELRLEQYHDISLEYYYHPNHDMNHASIDASTKETLAYCIENFGAYSLNHIRIAEIPSYYNFGGAAHPGLISMVEDNLYLIDIRNTSAFDLVSKRTIHEIAHQWWGMMLTPKNVAGGGFITEGFAKYTEGVVLERMYGKGALWELNKAANERYFRGRTYARTKEPPLYLEDGQNYLAYGKSGLVMQGLRDLIGEKKLNEVLRILTERHAGSQEFEVHSLEFLDELYKVSPKEYHSLVDEWMKQVVRYDLSIGASSYKALDDGMYELSIEIKARRFITLENGKEKEIGINEPIQIGLFMKHPKNLDKDDTPIYLESHLIKDNSTLLKIQLKTVPNIVALDPFLTRLDRVYSDNISELQAKR